VPQLEVFHKVLSWIDGARLVKKCKDV